MTGTSSLSKSMNKCSKCKLSFSFDSFYKGYHRCKSCDKQKSKLYTKKNSDKISEKKAAYYVENKQSIDAKNAQYRLDNQEKIRILKNSYHRNRLKQDPAYRAIHNVRNRLWSLSKEKVCFSKSIGCTLTIFKKHLELQFKPGMNWSNYGEWHIDHIFPLSVAYKEGQDSFSKACYYTNLQPLWAHENRAKGDSA